MLLPYSLTVMEDVPKAVFTGTWEGGGRCGSDTLGTRLSGVFEIFPLRFKVK